MDFWGKGKEGRRGRMEKGVKGQERKGRMECKGENRKRESGEERVMGWRRGNGGKEGRSSPFSFLKVGASGENCSGCGCVKRWQ